MPKTIREIGEALDCVGVYKRNNDCYTITSHLIDRPLNIRIHIYKGDVTLTLYFVKSKSYSRRSERYLTARGYENIDMPVIHLQFDEDRYPGMKPTDADLMWNIIERHLDELPEITKDDELLCHHQFISPYHIDNTVRSGASIKLEELPF